MKKAAFFLFIVSLFSRSFGQHISAESNYPVAYQVKTFGYPMHIRNAGNECFMYVEYWPKGIEGHKESNYYLQKVKTSNYQEAWNRALTLEGHDQMARSTHLVKLEKSYVALGRMYVAKEKKFHTVARFFELDGRSPALEPTIISNYDKKAKKGFSDQFDVPAGSEKVIVSPGEKCFLWLATDGKRHFATLWQGMGAASTWGKELKMAGTSKYKIKDVVVDDAGNPTLLLDLSKPSLTLKDTLYPPLIYRYDFAANKFAIDTVKLDSGAIALDLHLAQVNNDEVMVGGIVSNFQNRGFLNGAKATGKEIRWTHLYMAHYKVGEKIEKIKSTTSLMPKNWMQKYAVSPEGSNFASTELNVEGATAVFRMEEIYKSGDKYFYYDIAVAGFNVEDGAVKYGSIIPKKQRDLYPTFLSYAYGQMKGKSLFVYMSEMGATGKLTATSINNQTGEVVEKVVATNEKSDYLFFPERAGMVSGNQMALIGLGEYGKNNYKLFTISFN